MSAGVWIVIVVVGVLLAVAVYDVIQKKHAILRNFPVIGHLRYLLEMVGPELRQYIVTNNDEERPFSRDERRWVYASSKKQNNYFGFGTDNDLERSPNYLIVKHAAFYDPPPDHPSHLYPVPCGKVLGAARGRPKAFRPQSIINVSAMSFGSLSAAAIEAINKGCRIAGCLHNTGEGGVSPYHDNGGELIWQLGTGYFGARGPDGRFSMPLLKESAERFAVRAIEIKLSQGAKPGKGGLLPAAKITSEIAQIRGIPMGQDCVSPAYHTEFRSADELLDFVEKIADETGLPVGIKSAVGDLGFWDELAELQLTTDRGVDYIAVDGGEGGTGAAPLVFSDHVALPFRMGFARVYRTFAQRGLHHDIVFIGAGKLGFPERAALAFAMGVDMIAVAREAMLSIGCIQAQRCHTGHCPAGVATQTKWLMRGLEPTSKAARLANYMVTFRKELLWLCHACGVDHPHELSLQHFEILDEKFGSRCPSDVFGLEPSWSLPPDDQRAEIRKLMRSVNQTVPPTAH